MKQYYSILLLLVFLKAAVFVQQMGTIIDDILVMIQKILLT